MADILHQILARPIQLADQLAKAAEYAQSFKEECAELGIKAGKVASLLRQVAHVGDSLYDRPAHRIVGGAEQALRWALKLVLKCQARNSLARRVFTMMAPVAAVAFRKASVQLESSVADVSWLLRVSVSMSNGDYDYLGLPPIALNKPVLCLVWEQIAILRGGRPEKHLEAAATLASLACDNDRYGKLIVEEGGVPPLLKLAKEGVAVECRENAVKAIGLLGRAHENVDPILKAGVGSVFAEVLREGRHTKAQVAVVWAVSELATSHPKCQDHFVQNNVVQLLVSHVTFETVQEQCRYASAAATAATKKPKVYSIIPVVTADSDDSSESNRDVLSRKTSPTSPVSLLVVLNKIPSHTDNVVKCSWHELLPDNHRHDRHRQHIDIEDPATEAEMEAMVARALWLLAKGNTGICQMITKSKAFLGLAMMLEKGSGDVRSYSAQALMEITAMAERHPELRRSAFKPASPAAKAVVERLMRVIVIEDPDSNVLIPCIRSIGSLARMFRATETGIIGPLVKLLDGQDRDARVKAEAVTALGKFACPANFLHFSYCQAIVSAGSARHITQLVYSSNRAVQVPALVLLCYIALHVPDSETLAQEDALAMIEWSSKQHHLSEEPLVKSLLPKARHRLELYQSRSSRQSRK